MLQFFNTLTRKKEEFKPIHKKKVGFYSCGPTVYDFAHIGNFRAYIFADLLKRFLKYKGFEVTHIMNITDVDDKTIRNSQAQGISLKEFTMKYSKFFFEDIQALNIQKADVYPMATAHIPEMIAIIEKLLEKKIAYKAEDGIYYDIKKFRKYGELAHLDLSELKAGARVANDEYDKQSAQDFALWKFWSAKDGDVFWEAPFGKGRPGWHIECSAMSMKYLGETFDIHSGGIDLVFPHHQNEVAQSEAFSGKHFVNYWLHNEHLIVEGKKMSKSLGNFFTLRDLLKKKASPMAVRYLLLSVHYRQQLNFTFESLNAAANAVEKLDDFYSRMIDIAGKNIGLASDDVSSLIDKSKQDFEKALDDDLNISEALAAIFEFMGKVNSKESLSSIDAKEIISFMDSINSVIGIISYVKDELEPELMELINKREHARKVKDFALADKYRKELLSRGIQIDDAKDGFRWKRLKKL
ncbi:MAG: cysteine--tRNA ligase [Nanoarchaeota archaeon]|nr:MAG: cysteine--tRNA ligase [Nanoarchaeota archaeon]